MFAGMGHPSPLWVACSSLTVSISLGRRIKRSLTNLPAKFSSALMDFTQVSLLMLELGQVFFKWIVRKSIKMGERRPAFAFIRL